MCEPQLGTISIGIDNDNDVPIFPLFGKEYRAFKGRRRRRSWHRKTSGDVSSIFQICGFLLINFCLSCYLNTTYHLKLITNWFIHLHFPIIYSVLHRLIEHTPNIILFVMMTEFNRFPLERIVFDNFRYSFADLFRTRGTST